jgi:peptidoglycan hydrolase-like protein with peptidoglycan-binding domain
LKPSIIRICAGVTALVAGLWLASPHLMGQANVKTPGKALAEVKPPSAKTAAAQRSRAAKAKAMRSSARRRRPVSQRRRLARLRLESKRVEEIQRALIQAGYLNKEPTGKWDDPTRAAMLRYQTDHGFPTTGLPEAKSLMKLGLGPHALPEDVDPSAATRAAAEDRTKDNASRNQSPPTDSPRSGSPPQE